MNIHGPRRLTLPLALFALWLGFAAVGVSRMRAEDPARLQRGGLEVGPAAAPAGSADLGPTPWGLVPYWNDMLENPVHPPRVVYLNIYWIDLKPTAAAPLTPKAVLDAVEKRLGRPLTAAGPPVAVRFIATGDLSNNRPLPSWFKDTWWAHNKCVTECGQQLPAWKEQAQLDAHAEIVEALAAALDGHAQVVWVEPGSYGFWGEGHLDGAPADCVPSVDTRAALIRPWVKWFRKTPLSVTMDWIRDKDDPQHKLRKLWGSAASIGLRFDCLGFWHDQYASAVKGMADAGVSGWTGPWGGEFCYAEGGAKWSMGDDAFIRDDIRNGAPPAVVKMSGDARRSRVLRVLHDCGWSYVAGAGGSLLEQAYKGGGGAKDLEGALGVTRDLHKCAEAARVGHP
jgi:hypothetical protein